jgi:hypothetical protein
VRALHYWSWNRPFAISFRTFFYVVPTKVWLMRKNNELKKKLQQNISHNKYLTWRIIRRALYEKDHQQKHEIYGRHMHETIDSKSEIIQNRCQNKIGGRKHLIQIFLSLSSAAIDVFLNIWPTKRFKSFAEFVLKYFCILMEFKDVRHLSIGFCAFLLIDHLFGCLPDIRRKNKKNLVNKSH